MEFPSERTILQQTDLKRSFLKALVIENGAAKNETDVCNVLNFIETHLDDENPEISYLIEANLCYLHYYFSNFTMTLIDDGANVRSNCNLDHRREVEATWLSSGIEVHKLLIKFIEKYKDTQWKSKNNGRHAICVYYALQIMNLLCLGQDKNNINTIIKETNVIQISLKILTCGNNYFLEQCAAVKLLMLLIHHGNDITEILSDMQQVYNLNAIKLLISQCCNSFNILLEHEQLTNYQKIILSKHYNQINETKKVMKRNPGSSDEMMTYARSPLSDSNKNTQALHLFSYKNRMNTIKTLRFIAKLIRNPKRMAVLCNEKDVPTIYLKRLLQVSMFYMRQGKVAFPPQENTIDIISVLAQDKSIAERLVSDTEIIENLIIGIRSRSHMCEFAHREFIPILYCIVCEHDLLPKKYYSDLILVLNDIKEINWKNISFYSNIFPHYTLSIMVIKMLKKLFGVSEFEKQNQEKYECAICQEHIQYPYKVNCGHSFCFGCLDRLLVSSQTFYGYYIQKKQNEPGKCPLCRGAIVGQFNRVDKLSTFKLNKTLMDQIKKELICFKNEEMKCEFEGTENEFWEYIKTNNDEHKILLNDEFIDFCEFMKKKTSIISQRKQLISAATQIKMEGNKLFKEKQHAKAIEKYKEALNVCPLDEYKLRSKFYSNIALCYVNINDYFNAYRATQKGTALIYSPREDRTFVKLTNNMIISLNELLKDTEVFNKYHIQVGANNSICANRRLYDVLLYQYLWDFESAHTQYQLLESGIQTVENLMNIKNNDPYLKKAKKIEQGIDRYMQLNFDEFQLRDSFNALEAEKKTNVEEEKDENEAQRDYDVIQIQLYKWEQ